MLYSATFGATAAELEILWTKQTDRGGHVVGEPFKCGDLLASSQLEDAACAWVDDHELRADATDAAELVPGSTLTILGDVLRVACQDTRVCACDDAAAEASVVVHAPDDPTVPSPILEGPATAAVCGHFTLTADQSLGSGGRAFEKITWNASIVEWASNVAGDATFLAEAVEEANVEHPMTFSLTSAALAELAEAGARTFAVSLDLMNFLGVQGSSAPFLASIRGDAPPSVAVVGGPAQNVFSKNPLDVRATALASSCDGRNISDRGVSYKWTLYDASRAEATALVSQSSDPRAFKLDPFCRRAFLRMAFKVWTTHLPRLRNAAPRRQCKPPQVRARPQRVVRTRRDGDR